MSQSLPCCCPACLCKSLCARRSGRHCVWRLSRPATALVRQELQHPRCVALLLVKTTPLQPAQQVCYLAITCMSRMLSDLPCSCGVAMYVWCAQLHNKQPAFQLHSKCKGQPCRHAVVQSSRINVTVCEVNTRDNTHDLMHDAAGSSKSWHYHLGSAVASTRSSRLDC
jgi:hypothetical protein